MKPVPLTEALAWARKQKVVLPTEYYGLLQGRARAAAFSISGVAVLDQIEQVKAGMEKAMEQGWSFGKWKKAVAAGEVPLNLPAHRIETIFRTNIQGWYAAGRCRSIQANKSARPYLLYSAVNDSRTRPSHAAMHGFIARVDDPIWKTWMPPAGFNCRCTVIGLSEEQAKRRGFKPFPGQTPDTGWDYSVCENGPEEGVARAIEGRKGRCGRGLAADPVEHIVAELAAREPWWCRYPALQLLIAGYLDSLEDWEDTEKLARSALGEAAWSKHVKTAGMVAAGMGLDVPEAVVARAYTDFDLDAWPLMNRLARELPHHDPLPPMTEAELIRAGLLVHLMDGVIEKLPKIAGTFQRGVDAAGLGTRREQFLKSHTRRGRVVAWEGYTSIMDGNPFQYGIRFILEVNSAVDLRPLSVQQKPELVLPRSMKIRVMDYERLEDHLRIEAEEVEHERPIRREHHFGAEA